jgi:hypothetical protein
MLPFIGAKPKQQNKTEINRHNMKRKKKPNTQQAMKHLATQYRADFFRKMKLIIDSVCGKDIYPLIPQSTLDDAYLCRNAPFKFKVDENSIVSSIYLKDAKVILPHLFKDHIIQLPPHQLEITISEYFTVYMTIMLMHTRISATSFGNALKVKEALQLFIKDEATFVKANSYLNTILNTYSLGESDLSEMLYWLKHDIKIPQAFPSETENQVTIYSVIPESITVEVDGNVRPAIRVGWAFAYVGVEWISLKPSDLGIKSSFAKIPLKTYIQSHAINRLSERIDCFETGLIQFNMYISLVKPVIAHDNNHNLLIEFNFFGTKAGYFRADIVNGIVLIRTFLFVTNNGTPEGQLLEKNTGLQMLDKKYLAIDKLSTFMTSDLDKNEEVRRIFRSSGCQCLLDLYEKMKPLVTKHNKSFDMGLMLKYMNGATMVD